MTDWRIQTTDYPLLGAYATKTTNSPRLPTLRCPTKCVIGLPRPSHATNQLADESPNLDSDLWLMPLELELWLRGETAIIIMEMSMLVSGLLLEIIRNILMGGSLLN